MIKYTLILGSLIISLISRAQSDIPIGSWRTHYSFRDAHSLAAGESGIYCAGANTLFFLDLQDNSLTRISKLDGLSDTRISAVGYYQPLKSLVIAYENGNIDLLVDNQVINIPQIMDAQIGVSKTISHITFYRDLAYLSAIFGVAVLDLQKHEVKEAYTNIGLGGQSMRVNSSTVYRDTLFLAAAEGIIGGSLDPGTNLQDFKNWKRYGPSHGMPPGEVSAVGSNEGQLLASIDFDGIYYYLGAAWSRLDYNLDYPSLHMTSGSSPMVITTSQNLLLVDNSYDLQEFSDEVFSKPQSTRTESDLIWIADSVNGLISPLNNSYSNVFPNGPFSDSLFSVQYLSNTLIALPPGYSQLRDPARTTLGFYTFQDGSWTNYNASGLIDTQFFPAVKDLVDVTLNETNNKFYFASFGEGIIEWEPGDEIRILDDTTPGSTLQNIFPGGRNVLVSSVFADQDGHIWSCNYGNPSPVHRFNPVDGSWKSYQTSFQAGQYPLDMLMSDNGDFWLRLDPINGGGILVINSETQIERHLTNIRDEGGLPSRRVNDLASDMNGQIWVATDDGVVSYPFPFEILQSSTVNASPVLIDGRPLLKGEIVTSITVDGGNRKWIGTENGIWLFAETGDRVINNFTNENSPLPSNLILDIEINPDNGEVFIITDAGMISYRGNSTVGSRIHQQVKIFPNPVTREYNGVVGISGLSNNAVVKVADVTGKLVKEFAAAGGTAVWDISDYQGRRVKSGVYLVFSSSDDGNETFIGKIAVVN